MKKIVLKIFPALDFYWQMVGWRLCLLVFISLMLGFSESFSLGLLIPIFQGYLSESNHSVANVMNDNQMLNALKHVIPGEVTLNGLLWLFIGFMILKSVFKYFALNYTWVLISNMNFNIRKKLINKLMHLDYKAYLSLETGKISNAMTSEIDRCMGGFLYFTQYLTAFFTGLAFIIILFWVNYKFSLTIIILGVIYYLVFRKLTNQIKIVSHQISKEGAIFNSLLIQVFQSFKYIKAAAFYIPFGKRLISSIWKMRNDKLKIMRRQGLLTVLQEMSLITLLLTAFFLNLKYFNSDFASILLSVILFYRASGYILNSQNIWGNYFSMAGGTQTVVDNDKWLGANLEKPFGKLEPKFNDAIRLKEVTFSYTSERKILDNISLEIPKNSTVAFVGKSGSGKSTLVNLLAGLLRPESGSIFIDNEKLEGIDITAWRKKIGYVTQEPILFTDTIENNITMWSEASQETTESLNNALKRAHIDEFVNSIGGIDKTIGDKGAILSGGQRQRLSIGREFFKQPELLIFDEATSSLDAESEAFIQRSIDEQHGKITTIIIAHRLSTLRNADIIFMLSKGKIIEQGSFNELISKKDSSFYEFVKLQTV